MILERYRSVEIVDMSSIFSSCWYIWKNLAKSVLPDSSPFQSPQYYQYFQGTTKKGRSTKCPIQISLHHEQLVSDTESIITSR